MTMALKEKLAPTLAQLEAALEMPVVPGELSEWTEKANAAANELQELLPNYVRQIHQREFDEIIAQDPSLASRVEDLRAEDREILCEFSAFQQSLHALVGAAETVEPNEARLDPRVERLAMRGLELVIRIRRQEAAASTWLVEAFQRDRGVAD